MKWFKHMTDASDDEFIAMLEAEFGDWGYARWWRLLEVVGAQMKPGCCRAVAKYPPRKWKELLRGSPKKLQLFFNFLQTSCKVSASFSEKVWEIEIPKLLELRDNYTKDYQETGKKLSSHTETDPEEEAEEEAEQKADQTADAMSGLLYGFQKMYPPRQIGMPIASVNETRRLTPLIEQYGADVLLDDVRTVYEQDNGKRYGLAWFLSRWEQSGPGSLPKKKEEAPREKTVAELQAENEAKIKAAWGSVDD